MWRLVNAPGTGIADDKAVYAFVPEIIRYYLGEEIILPNVPTYVCGDDTQCRHVLDKLDELVIKPANESGGYGIVLGPRASQQQRDECRERIRANPRNFVAQPMLSLSRVPTVIGDSLEGRHVDLRPFILYGEEIYVLPGGLTRVAAVRIRSSSTLRRVAAAKTPGLCTPTGHDADALTRCRIYLLDESPD